MNNLLVQNVVDVYLSDFHLDEMDEEKGIECRDDGLYCFQYHG